MSDRFHCSQLGKESMIKLIDVGFGNISSLKNWMNVASLKFEIVRENQVFHKSDIILMPGVGSAGFAMRRLAHFKILDRISDHIASGGRYIGICVGMHLLYEDLDEGQCDGLGIFGGTVERLGNTSNTKWSELTIEKRDLSPSWRSGFGRKLHFKGRVFNNHSYGVKSFQECEDSFHLMDSTDSFVQLIGKPNVIGFQFHPEKSQIFGDAIAKFIGELP